MCASYGLDPRYDDKEYQALMDAAILDGLRSWAEGNHGETLLPTGVRMRNLNPIFTSTSHLEMAWWGYLVGGATARFPSINTRSERLASGSGPLPARAIVPASYWREMQKPQKIWHHLSLPGDELLGMAAVIRPGVTADGATFTCYSLVMQPAAEHIADVHDRMPLLIPPGFTDEWLTSDAPAGEMIDAATAAAQPLAERVIATPQGGTTPTLL
ncbi:MULTISPECIES: SOS response-associated peptidase family protein [Bacteria]|uniref:SOS response-associated peptidase family protein n=1 Tax=Bacteria TaxID=2 RepID=UPI003C7AAF29